MGQEDDKPVAALLADRAARGDAAASDQLVPLVYDELRSVAAMFLARERADHTLHPTELVHEAYMRLVGDAGAGAGRTQFLRVAAKVMRQVLVDHARARQAKKRGEGWGKVTLTGVAASGSDVEIVELEEALGKLAEVNERLSTLVELRYFGGLKNAEAADVLGVSVKTVETDWALAQAWLHRILE